MKIAVVIPAFNAGRYIVNALQSVACQSRPADEIILVDDGSTDTTIDAAKGWAMLNDQPLKVISQANKGVSAARNAGIHSTSADAIAFLDADDIYLSHHLHNLEAGFSAGEGIVLCFGDASSFNDNDNSIIRDSYLAGSRILQLPYSSYHSFRVIQGSAYLGLIRGSRIATCSTLVSREALIRIGGFDEKIATSEDRDLFLRLSRLGRFTYVPLTVSRIRRRAGSLSSRAWRNRTLRHAEKVLLKMLSLSNDLDLTSDEIKATKEALFDTRTRMLREAASRGIGPYFQNCVAIATKGCIAPFLSPQLFADAVVSTFQNKCAQAASRATSN